MAGYRLSGVNASNATFDYPNSMDVVTNHPHQNPAAHANVRQTTNRQERKRTSQGGGRKWAVEHGTEDDHWRSSEQQDYGGAEYDTSQVMATAVRSEQSTRQLVYDIYGWTLSSIETLEKMENEELFRSQGVQLSDPTKSFYQTMQASGRTTETMVDQCSTYLQILRTTLNNQSVDLKTDLCRELGDTASAWCQTGLEGDPTHGKELGNAAFFKEQLLRVFDGHKPAMPRASVEAEQRMPQMSSAETRGDAFYSFQRGRYTTEEVEKAFDEDPKRKASRPVFRQLDPR